MFHYTDNLMKKYIKRHIYQKKIEPFLNKNLIKVIIGQRRVGKSYFMLQMIDYFKHNFPEIPTLYLNKEDLAFDDINNYKDLVDYIDKNSKDVEKQALFIDEIQEIKGFEKALRHYQNTEKWDIYCTGSNANLLSGELATYLSGRYIEIKIYGLSYREFLQFHNSENTPESFSKYIKYGGLPYLKNLPQDDDVVFDYLKNIFSTILFKDIISRFNIRNISFIERLCTYIADNIGNLISAKKINDYLKSQKLSFSNNTVLDYLAHLANALLVLRVQRNDLKGKRLLEIGEKIYFQDIGLRHALISYKQNNISQVLENIVYLHLLRNDYEVTIGKIGDKEIDFVCDKSNERIYVQVTLSLADENVKKRELENLLKIKDNFRKIVITADEYTENSNKGLEIWNIRRFLMEF